MSKTFIAVDRHGRRRMYLGNHLPSWWIRLSLRLHRWTAEEMVTMGVVPRIPMEELLGAGRSLKPRLAAPRKPQT